MKTLLLPLIAAMSLLLSACPKAPPTTTIAGTDDERMDVYSAQLEEQRTRTGLACADYCSGRAKVCDLSKNICDITNARPERQDFQAKCIAGQEECARYNEQCSSCAAK